MEMDRTKIKHGKSMGKRKKERARSEEARREKMIRKKETIMDMEEWMKELLEERMGRKE